MTIKDTGKTLDKVIVTDKAMGKINPFELAKRLGAQVVSFPELTKEEVESNHYMLLGSPVVVPSLDNHAVYYFGSRMLNQQGLSLDYVVGYVVSNCGPTSTEEPELRQACGKHQVIIVRYYGKELKS